MTFSSPSEPLSTSSSSLILRVQRDSGEFEELYVHPGLSIGRSAGNTVVLADDATVDRAHAQVRIAADGDLHLCCLQPDTAITCDGVAVSELKLISGVRFHVGRTQFECVSGSVAVMRSHAPLRTACPICGWDAAESVVGSLITCPQCDTELLCCPGETRQSTPEPVPIRYGQFLALRFAARGGMALVLRGQHSQSRAPVAIKLLSTSAQGAQAAERFTREITLMERVCHSNLVALRGHGRTGRFRYLVADWIDGWPLKELIATSVEKNQPVPFRLAARWIEQVASGLAELHKLGVVHRDIKPSNILIGADKKARLADFGVAKRDDIDSATDLTTTGQLPGTFAYMAPEQFSTPDAVDPRADQYSLGVTLYELLTHKRPVGTWRPASTLNPTIPTEFDAVIARLLEPLPQYRYSSVDELIHTLQVFRTRPVAVSNVELRSAVAESDAAPHSIKSSASSDRNDVIVDGPSISQSTVIGRCIATGLIGLSLAGVGDIWFDPGLARSTTLTVTGILILTSLGHLAAAYYWPTFTTPSNLQRRFPRFFWLSVILAPICLSWISLPLAWVGYYESQVQNASVRKRLALAALLWSLAWTAGMFLLSLNQVNQAQPTETHSVPNLNTTRYSHDLATADGSIRMTLGADWNANDTLQEMHPGLKLAAADRSQTAFLGISSENRSDFVRATLQDYVQHLRSDQEATYSVSNSLSIAGRPAVQFESAWIGNGVKVRALVTITETNREYVVATCWTVASQFERFKPEFIDMVHTIQFRP